MLYVSRDSFIIRSPGGAQMAHPEASFWTPILSSSYGLNHIDGRLGACCNLAIMGLK